MRMVGNMSTSVDYRVITILDAPGKENGRVTHRGENRAEKQHIQQLYTGNERKERQRERIFIP